MRLPGNRASVGAAALVLFASGSIATGAAEAAPPAASGFSIRTFSYESWFFNLRELGVVSGEDALFAEVLTQPELWSVAPQGICLSMVSTYDDGEVGPVSPKVVYDSMQYRVCNYRGECSSPQTISFDDTAGVAPSPPRSCVEEDDGEPPVESDDLEHAAPNPNARRVARVLSGICPLLGESEYHSRDQADLRDLCQVLVDNPGEATGALDAITPEEVLAFGTVMIEMSNAQRKNIDARLQALRAGATGVSVDGLALQIGDGLVSGAMLPGVFGAGGAADPGFDRLGLFASGNFEFGDQDTSLHERGYDFGTYGGTIGADYRITDAFILGASYGFSVVDLDFHQFSGDMDVRSHGASIFGTYYVEDLYVDAFANWTWMEFDYRRQIRYTVGGTTVSRTAKSDPGAWQLQLAANTGYNLQSGAWTVNPYAGIIYLDGRIERFTESGASGLNIAFDRQRVDSLRTRLGLAISRAIGTSYAVWTPQVRGEWLHEYLNDIRTVTGSFAADPTSTPFTLRANSPDRNFFRVGAGLAAQFAKGVAAYADWEWTLDLNRVDQHSFLVGVRMEF